MSPRDASPAPAPGSAGSSSMTLTTSTIGSAPVTAPIGPPTEGIQQNEELRTDRGGGLHRSSPYAGHQGHRPPAGGGPRPQRFHRHHRQRFPRGGILHGSRTLPSSHRPVAAGYPCQDCRLSIDLHAQLPS